MLATASEVVALLGAVQAQDYGSAKWALAQRTRSATDADVETELAAGAILRTHILRPTWHFVAPADISWMLTLSAPRVHAANAYWYRWLEVDDTVARRSRAVLTKALRDRKQLTRAELGQLLRRARIQITSAQRLACIVMRAELDGLICSGARRGNQFTYAPAYTRARRGTARAGEEILLDERSGDSRRFRMVVGADEGRCEEGGSIHGPRTGAAGDRWQTVLVSDSHTPCEANHTNGAPVTELR